MMAKEKLNAKGRTRTLRQTVMFDAGPGEVYEAYMDPAKHTAFTGDEARFARRKGARFSAGGGYIDGKLLELVPGERVVQTWRGSDWPEGHYSELTLTLKGVEGGTRLSLVQKGVPVEHADEIDAGWHEFYWEPLREWLRGCRT
jgi:activator of HSP90 ATPase